MSGNIINKREAGDIIQSVALAVAVTSNRINHQSPEVVAWLDGFASACGIIALGLGVEVKTVQPLDSFPRSARNPNFTEGVRILMKGVNYEF